MNSKYVYDDTQKGMFEKAREAAGFIAWCVAIGGGMGGCTAIGRMEGLITLSMAL